MHNNKGFVIVLLLITFSIIMTLSTYLVFSSSLNNQIINTSIKNLQAFYRSEDKLNLCFNKHEYYEEDLIPRLKHFIRYNKFSNHPNKDEILLDERDLEEGDSINTLHLDVFRENGILKGSIRSESTYENINKNVFGIFNIINPIYYVNPPILSKNRIDNEIFFNELFNDFTLIDFEDKAEIIEVKNYDRIELYLTNKFTNKVRIEFFRYGQNTPVQTKHLSKTEVFLVIKNDDNSSCQLSVYSEGDKSDNKMKGILYVQGDLNLYDNIEFNGIIVIDGGKLNVYSEEKPNVHGLMILNNFEEEELIEDKINLSQYIFYIESYGIYLPNFIKPDLYLIKEKWFIKEG